MNPGHPGFEELSAYHDGEAPQWADHVTACAPCRNRVAELADLSGLVAQIGPPTHGVAPPAPERPSDRGARPSTGDDAVGRAVAAVAPDSRGIAADPSPERADTQRGESPEPDTRLEDPPEPRRWWMGASVAAMLVFTVAVGALVASRSDRPSTSTAVGPGAGNRTTAEADAAGGAGGAGTPSVIVAGDLGEIGDRAALVARVRAGLDAARTSTPGQDQAAAPGAAAAPASPESLATSAPGDPAPCEPEARRGPGERGAVIYQATAEKDGTPAVVLAFGPPREPDPVTVEVRARSDCRLLLQGAIL